MTGKECERCKELEGLYRHEAKVAIQSEKKVQELYNEIIELKKENIRLSVKNIRLSAIKQSVEICKNKTLPDGWIDFTPIFNVSGINKQLPEVNTSLDYADECPKAFIVHETDNEQDENAIQVFVKRTMFKLLPTKFHIGYLPTKLAKIVLDYELERILIPRIHELQKYDNGGRVVTMDLIGPEKLYTERLCSLIQRCMS